MVRLRSYVERNELLVAGWRTIVEINDGLVRHYSPKEAATELARLLSSPRIRVEDSEPHLPGAMELLRGRPNWGVDLSDCLSFSLMKAKGIQQCVHVRPGFLEGRVRGRELADGGPESGL